MRRCIWGLGVLLASAACEDDAPKPEDEPVTLGLLTGLDGTTEPCGCTSKPLGGLDRIAARVQSLDAGGSFGLLVVGETLFTYADPPAHRFEQERKKAEVIAQVLSELGPVALLPGPEALTGVHGELARDLFERFALPAFLPRKTQDTRSRADSTLRTVGGLKVGVVGMPVAGVKESNSYNAGAAVLRRQGADIVVALVPYGGQRARAFVQRLDGVDVAVGAGDSEVHPPRMVGGTLLLEAGDRGRYLGELVLHPKPLKKGEKRAWVFNDRGETKKSSLRARIARLEQAIARMPEGSARAAREEMRDALKAELAAVKTPVPKGSFVTFESEPITESVEPAGWATRALVAYNRSLCEITERATADRVCPKPEDEANGYVGNARCGACHPDALKVWEGTQHAVAWETLVDRGKECDLGCIGCHSVGYERPGGYCRLSQAKAHGDVGCESCHGPGAGHSAAPHFPEKWGDHFSLGNEPSTCVRCHNTEHSDLFDFAVYLPKVLGPGHGQPLEHTSEAKGASP